MKISVIIPTKNSENTLKMLFESLKKQTFQDFEIIVVDNFSQDKTKEIALTYTPFVFEFGPERSSQRNFGAHKARGDFLLFLDSDMFLEKDVLEKCLAVKVIVIPEKSIGKGFWAKCRILEKECYLNDPHIEAARFFSKKIFFQFQGYNEKIKGGGEDWDLPERIKKAGYKIYRIDSFIYHNEGYLSFFKNLKKKYYYAQTLKYYIKNHKKDFWKKIFRWHLFKCLAKNFFRHPLLVGGIIILKTSEFLVGGIAFLKSLFTKYE